MFTRRAVLAGTSATMLALAWPSDRSIASGLGERRLVFLMLRGGLDGLEAIMPLGDPSWSAIGGRQNPLGTPVPVDAFFAMHGSLAPLEPMVQAGELKFVHAVATPYRERSHFDAQNILETGGRRAYELKQGWLSRLVAAMGGDASDAVALSGNLPVALQGEIPFGNYPNAKLIMPSPDFSAQLARLWAGDVMLAETFRQAQRAFRVLKDSRTGNAAQLAAHFLAHPEGARIAVLNLGGYDTHSNQKYRLGSLLRDLQHTIITLKSGLGPHWGSTIVVAATEFGRTVAINGAAGTDHGAGTVAFVAGGALLSWGLKQPVISDWPGLKAADLHQGRDLKPTRDLRGLLLAISARQFEQDHRRMGPLLFPGPDRISPDPTFI